MTHHLFPTHKSEAVPCNSISNCLNVVSLDKALGYINKDLV